MKRNRMGLIALIAVVAAVVYPFVFSSTEATTIVFYALLYVAIASSWNIIGGFTGYISLGHAAFFGLGAYTIALVADHLGIPGGYGLFLVALLGGVVAALFAVPMGFIALRLRTIHSFVIVTIAYLFMFQLLAFNLLGVTNGSSGLAIPQPNWSGAFFNMPFYFAALVLAVLTVLLAYWIRNSRFGLGLLAIRDDEDKAAGVGVDTWKHKFAAYIISAVPIGIAGAIYAYFSSYIYPQTVFDPMIDLTIVLSAFLGGMGTLLGPILGAFILQPAQQLLTFYTGAAGWDLVLFGVLFLVVILLMPSGIVPTIVERTRRARVREAVQKADETVPTPDANPAAGGGPR
ncbi:MAG: branched-chain amino acid ABC transporter permease [Thermaerobacter sp.]|nr:branched-chain amino acid ABC transporter permease [Thermaerobacter sp.]